MTNTGGVKRLNFFGTRAFVRIAGSAGEDSECGVVVQPERDGGALEYYVARFGASLEAGQPGSTPSLHRFAAAPLERVENDPRKPIWERRRKTGFGEKLMKSRAFWALLLILKSGVWVALIVVLLHPPACR